MKSGINYKKAFSILGFVFLGLYFTLLLGLYIFQRPMLFQNKPQTLNPDLINLPIQDIRVTTPDKEILQAWYEPPKPGLPVVLFFSGQGANLDDSKWRYLRLHDKGVGYLALAYRGFSGSTGQPSEQGLYIDGLAAYDHLRHMGYRPDQIVIHGFSLGTGVATYVASQRRVKAVILEAPYTAAVDIASAKYPLIPVSWLMRDKFLSRDRIGAIHRPLLIAHGDHDSVIDFKYGQRLFTLANQPKIFIRMKGSDHNTLTRDGVYNYYWDFLDVKTKGSSQFQERHGK